MSSTEGTQDMASIFDVSKKILEEFPFGISTRKLQKLAYFSQGWHLALSKDNEPLFPEDFEAWRYGPVSRTLYNEHRKMYSINEDDLSKGNAAALSDAQQLIVNFVINKYGLLSGMELTDLTHVAESPWSKIRRESGYGPDDPGDRTIPKDLIRAYFQERLHDLDQVFA